jgi:hypothetical protein
LEGESDAAKLLQLFRLAQAVMINRNNMVEESMAAAEDETKAAKKKGQLLCLFFSPL